MAERKTKAAFPQPDPYFIGPKSDFLMIGGVSLLLLPFLAMISSEPYFTKLLIAAFFAQFIVNFPHFAATSFRLYRSADNINAFPVTSYVIPFVITALTALALYSPALFAPSFLLIYFLWSPYHFSGQSSGVSMIYARRNGFRIEKGERFFLSGFIFSSFLINFIWLNNNEAASINPDREIAGSFSQSVGVAFYSIDIPSWTQWPVGLFLVLCGAVYTALMIRQAHRKNLRFPPLMVFVPAIVHFCWFTISARLGLLAFIALVPLFHSLQYLYIAWAVQLKEREGDLSKRNLKMTSPYKETVFWYFINIVLGIVLFISLPHMVSTFMGLDFWFCFLILSTGVQFHHFFVDGVIWKLRNPIALSALTTKVTLP